MRPTLILQPVHSSSSDILKCFALGKPLSSDQMNLLSRYQHRLSGPEFDPVYKYYIDSLKKTRQPSTSFLLPSNELTHESVQQLKKRLALLLQKKSARVSVGFTQKQLLQFRELGMHELIFWHGNQSLTGAPYFPGGIPPVIYFQWGNFFGIVKYVFLAEEKALKGNILVYFEDREERNLDQCVADYTHTLQQTLSQQENILHEHKIDPLSFNQFVIKTPTLSQSPRR